MKVLIVHAHAEPSSFNSALTETAVAAIAEAGGEVKVSDLYAMNFDPVSDRRNFTSVADPAKFSQQAEERRAVEVGGFAADVQAEIDKLLWSDTLIFQFPIWWLGLPGILKGWVDRVFAVGVAYGGGRWFDRGRLAGRQAMLSVTMGGPAPVYSDAGAYGPLAEILRPIHRGIFQFAGLEVIEPFVVYGPARMSDAERREELQRYRRRLLTLSSAPRLEMPRSDDYVGLVRRSDR